MLLMGLKNAIIVNNRFVRKRCKTLAEVRQEIEELMGYKVDITIDKGRNRTINYKGEVLALYPSVFAVSIEGDPRLNRMTMSYADMLCGKIMLSRLIS